MPAPPLVAIVLCGGSGARLWPLSRARKSKPFVTMPGGGTTMGELLGSLPGIGCDEVVFVTSEKQLDDVAAAAAGLSLPHRTVCEPSARNTAPALAAAMALVSGRHGKEAAFAMLPADHHIPRRDAFNDGIRKGVAAARAAGRIVVLGIEPTSPATGFGYIRAGERDGDALAVDAFVEKPPVEKAREMIGAGGHFWNAGVFISTVATMEGEFDRHEPSLAKASRALDPGEVPEGGVWRIEPEDYEPFPSVSIDVAVAERTEVAAVVPVADSGWSDLGDWADFLALVEPDGDGNRVVGDAALAGTSGSGVYSQTGRKVVLAGCEGTIVVDMPDALLVTTPGSEGRVREAHAAIAEAGGQGLEFPSVERRPWGNYRQLGAGPGWQVKRIEVDPGKRLSLQSHRHRSETWTVVSGVMRVTVDGKEDDLRPDESRHIPQGAKHRMANPGDVPAVVIEVQSGDYLGEDDIERYEDDFGRS